MAVSLESLTDLDLVQRLKKLVGTEKKLTQRIILHLAEVDRRRLYAEMGYPSLYDYAVRGLGYSEGSAQRRIKAARAMRKVPELYDCIEEGKISFAVLDVVSEALGDRHGREILRDVCGKSKQEAKMIVAKYCPVPAPKRDEVQVVFENVSSAAQSGMLELFPEENGRRHVAVEDQMSSENYRISFTASAEFMENLERVKELRNSGAKGESLEVVLGAMLDFYLDKRCPKRRHKKRARRSAEKRVETMEKALDTIQRISGEVIEKMADKDAANSRYIPVALRDAVLERDGHCCTFVAKDGTRCDARTDLQIDHITPCYVGGKSRMDNLRTTCRAHNHLYARRFFGDEYIDEILQTRKPDSNGVPTVWDGDYFPFNPDDYAEQLLFG